MTVGGALGGKDAGNYTFAGAVGNYTVTRLDANISGTRVYDATPTAAGTNLTTISALLAGDSVTVAGSGTVTDKNAAQNKDITNMGTLALAGTDAGNYNLLASGNKLNVTPAPLTVKADDASKSYGQTPVLSAFTTAGLINGETIGSICDKPRYCGKCQRGKQSISDHAEQRHRRSFSPSNYTITYIPGTLTVAPQVQTNPNITPTVTSQDQSIPNISPIVAPQDQSIPDISLTVTPQVQPNPNITLTVTPQVQQNPILTPTVTAQVLPGPIITTSVTPQVQPEPVKIQDESPQVQPEPVILSVKPPQVQPDPVISPPEKKLKRYAPPERPRKHDRN